jgi:hypothetical protein
MKIPQRHELRELDVQPFVLAADSPTHRAALDLLFIHGKDLAWDADRFGLYLMDAVTLQGHEAALGLALARAKLGGIQIARTVLDALRPKAVDWLANVVPQVQARGAAEEAIAGIVGRLVSDNEELMQTGMTFLPTAIGQLGFLVDGLAFLIVDEAQQRRERQLAATGLTSARYAAMLAALRDLELVTPAVRVALPANRRPELAFTSELQFMSALPQGTPTLEVLRVVPRVEALKVANESALAVFMSRYINAHLFHGTGAFASAQYGGAKQVEIDVAVPDLRLGVEVKVYNAPQVTNAQQIPNHANRLAAQFVQYKSVGVERFVYATNLRKQDAEAVVKDAKRILGMKQGGKEIHVVAGSTGAVLEWMDGVIGEIHQHLQATVERDVRKRLTRGGDTTANGDSVESIVTGTDEAEEGGRGADPQIE